MDSNGNRKSQRFKPFAIKKGIVVRVKNKYKKALELSKSRNESCMKNDAQLVQLRITNKELSLALNEQKMNYNVLFEEKIKLQQELLNYYEVTNALRKELKQHDEDSAQVQDVFRGALQLLLTLTDQLNSGMENVMAGRRRSRSINSGAAARMSSSLGQGRHSRHSQHDGLAAGSGLAAPSVRKLHKVLPTVGGNVISHPHIVLPRLPPTSQGWPSLVHAGPRRVAQEEQEEEEEEETEEDGEVEPDLPGARVVPVSAPPVDLSLILEQSASEEHSLSPLPEAQVVVSARERISGDEAWLQQLNTSSGRRRQRHSDAAASVGSGWRRRAYPGTSAAGALTSPPRPAPRRHSPAAFSPQLQQLTQQSGSPLLWNGSVVAPPGISPAEVRLPNVSLQRLSLENAAQWSPIVSGNVSEAPPLPPLPARVGGASSSAGPPAQNTSTATQYSLLSMELDIDLTSAGDAAAGAPNRAGAKTRRRKKARQHVDASAAGEPSAPPNLSAATADTTADNSVVISRRVPLPAAGSRIPVSRRQQPSAAAQRPDASEDPPPPPPLPPAPPATALDASLDVSVELKRACMPRSRLPVRVGVRRPPLPPCSSSSESASVATSGASSPTPPVVSVAAAVDGAAAERTASAAADTTSVDVEAEESRPAAPSMATKQAEQLSPTSKKGSWETLGSVEGTRQDAVASKTGTPEQLTPTDGGSGDAAAAEADNDTSLVSVVLAPRKQRRKRNAGRQKAAAAARGEQLTSAAGETPMATEPALETASGAAAAGDAMSTAPEKSLDAKDTQTGSDPLPSSEAAFETQSVSTNAPKRKGRRMNEDSSPKAAGKKSSRRSKCHQKVATGGPNDPLEGSSHTIWVIPDEPPPRRCDDVKLSVSPVVVLDRSSVGTPERAERQRTPPAATVAPPPAGRRRRTVDRRESIDSRMSIEVGRPATKRRQRVDLSAPAPVLPSVADLLTGAAVVTSTEAANWPPGLLRISPPLEPRPPAESHISSPLEPPGSNSSSPLEPPGSHSSSPLKPPGSHSSSPLEPPGSHSSPPLEPPGSHSSPPLEPPGSNSSSSLEPAGSHSSTPVEPPPLGGSRISSTEPRGRRSCSVQPAESRSGSVQPAGSRSSSADPAGSRGASAEPEGGRRRRKPVSYKEPTLNKKMRR